MKPNNTQERMLFEKPFEAHQRALELAAAMQPVLEAVAKRDRHLHDQMKRACASITLNLAEGAERRGQDRAQFYSIAAGSASELDSAMLLAISWGIISEERARPALNLSARVRSMLWRLLHPKPKVKTE